MARTERGLETGPSRRASYSPATAVAMTYSVGIARRAQAAAAAAAAEACRVEESGKLCCGDRLRPRHWPWGRRGVIRPSHDGWPLHWRANLAGDGGDSSRGRCWRRVVSWPGSRRAVRAARAGSMNRSRRRPAGPDSQHTLLISGGVGGESGAPAPRRRMRLGLGQGQRHGPLFHSGRRGDTVAGYFIIIFILRFALKHPVHLL